jgi:hypothetical protein
MLTNPRGIQERSKLPPRRKKLKTNWKTVRKYAHPSTATEGVILQEPSTEAQKRSTGLRMLKEGKRHTDIAIALGATAAEIDTLSKEYHHLEELENAYHTLGNDFSAFLELYGRMQSEK